MSNNYPDFFVVGTVKAGTTSLYNYLKQHPDVFVPTVKELHHFAKEIDPAKFITGYGKSFNEHFAFVKSNAEYLSYYQNEKTKLKGDFAPSNLWSTSAAHEIFQANSKAKIIALVRQPVERAFSHWLMDVKSGWSTKSFVQAFEDDVNAKEKGWGVSRLYKELGLYADALQRYFDVFPHKQIFVIDYNELTSDPALTYKNVLKFLELAPHSLTETKAFNQSKMPRHAVLDSVYQNKNVRTQIKQLLPTKTISWMKQTLLSTDRVPKLTANDRIQLLPHFNDDIQRLGVLLNRDFKHWLR